MLFEKIAKFRPSILVNVPTMVNHMVTDPAAVAVVGVVNDDGLTKPHAFVIRRIAEPGHAQKASGSQTPATGAENRDALADELQAWVRNRLEPYKYPREVTFVDDLPRTHLGKVDRGAVKARFVP